MSYSRVASEWVNRLHLISFMAYLFGFHLAMWVGTVVMTELLFCGVSEGRQDVSKQ